MPSIYGCGKFMEDADWNRMSEKIEVKHLIQARRRGRIRKDVVEAPRLAGTPYTSFKFPIAN
jgi:hypothetical protein